MKLRPVHLILAFTLAWAQAYAQTSAANGITIPHPTSTLTYPVATGSGTVNVPQGMVYIPAGNFTWSTGATQETRYLNGYCIGKFEVTNEEWKAWLNATGRSTYPTHWSGGTYPAGKANHPVLYISFNEVQQYCAWVSAQTGWNVTAPTSDQWEKAARGPNGYLYPTGNTTGLSYNASTGVLTSNFSYNGVTAAYYLYNFPTLEVTYNNVNSSWYGRSTTVAGITGYTNAPPDTSGTVLSISSNGSVSGWVQHATWTGFIYTSLFSQLGTTGGNTAPVGSYVTNGYGLYDVSGNVWEWCSTLITATNGAETGQIVNDVRGGSWYATSGSCKLVGIGEGRSASGKFNTIGLRLVMIPATPSPLTVSTSSLLPGAVAGVPYSQAFAATGGSGSGYVWGVSAGSLPSGFTLSTTGTLHGTSAAMGTFNFTVQVTDSMGASTTKAMVLTVTAAPLHHFNFDYAPSSASVGKSFAVRVTARDQADALFPSFSGSVALTATSNGGAGTSPIVITEVTDETVDQFELQNVSNAAVNTSGWYVRIGDAGAGSGNGTLQNLNTVNATQFPLPSSIPAGGIVNVAEGTGTGQFGSSIAWQHTPGASRGWVALFDSTHTLRDFFIFNWDAPNFASFNVVINGTSLTAANCGWSGAPIVSGTRVSASTFDSWQRQGLADTNSPADWLWKHNADHSNATSFNVVNSGLAVPWSFSSPVGVSPSVVTFTNGEFVGSIALLSPGNDVALMANDGAGHHGTSSAIKVNGVLADDDEDGLPDDWEMDYAITDPNADADGDGLSNLAEYLAGTNPVSAASALTVTRRAHSSATQFDLTFTAIAGKLYRVSTSTDLNSWIPVSTVILPTISGTHDVSIFHSGQSRRFFRIELVP
jgi:formylglycine-generating enzyme required for sulfatase activity